MDAVTIKNLSYRYPATGAYALKDVSLTAGPGELVSIVGANGAGKTTLCAAIRGFVPHFYQGEVTGEVTVAGKRVAEHSIGELAGDVGFVFQNPFTQMSGVTTTVFDEIAYGLGNMGVSATETVERVERILGLSGLTEIRDRDPLKLSGGQQQRVALASVLVMDQPVLVLDEPTSQLDPRTTDEVFSLIMKTRAEGRTIILVEHKMEQIAELSDRVVLLDRGGVALDGTPSEVFGDPLCEELGTRLPESLYLKRALATSGLDLPETPLTTAEIITSVTAQIATSSPQEGN
ncbi:ABC transporter ATP-binding protein [Promicromonospora xylanilytica]